MKFLPHLGALLLLLALPAFAADSTPPRPNILFIIFDDWGWQHAGAYGCDWVKTPNFDRVAREGILFKNAFTSNPKCSPCRATILCGRNTWQMEEATNHHGMFPKNFEVYPDLLEKAGYFVGLTGKGWGPGDFKTLAGRTRNPAGPSFDEAKTQPPATGINKLDYAQNFETFMQKRPAGQPFCFWMGFTEPHRFYELNSGVRLGKKLADVKVPAYLPDNEVTRGDLLDYSIEVEYGDQQVGKALATLEAKGELENTIVAITSDHGMPFPRVKGQIYEDGFHVPLAIRWPKTIKPGRVVEDFFNMRDLAPTWLELAGLPVHPQMTGSSLAGIFRAEKSGFVEDRKTMLVGKERHDLGRPHDWGYPVRAIRTTDFFYSHNYNPERWPACDPISNYANCDDGPTKAWIVQEHGYYFDLAFNFRPEEELYNIALDPECMHNLAKDPQYANTKQELRTKMDAQLVAEKDPRALGNGAIFDTYKYVGDKGKSYDERLKAEQEGTTPEKKKKGRKDGAESAGE